MSDISALPSTLDLHVLEGDDLIFDVEFVSDDADCGCNIPSSDSLTSVVDLSDAVISCVIHANGVDHAVSVDTSKSSLGQYVVRIENTLTALFGVGVYSWWFQVIQHSSYEWTPLHGVIEVKSRV